jgi:hypothetical protein
VEVAALSTSIEVEANDSSPPMLAALKGVLPLLKKKGGEAHIFPALGSPLADDMDFESRLAPQGFPHVGDSPALLAALASEGGHSALLSRITLQYGDFYGVYGHRGSWERFDAVVTCFFIDATPPPSSSSSSPSSGILDTIGIIRNILKPGGVWINTGPLHYHHQQQVPYSYAQLVEVITSIGFQQLLGDDFNRQIRLNSYCGEEQYSMKPESYNVPLSVFMKSPI